MPASQRGFSMFELVIAGIMVLLMATLTYRQYMNIVVDAERAAFDGVRGWLQAGVNLAMSDAIGQRGKPQFDRLDGANPMALLEGVMEPPSNYLGELAGPEVERAEPGNWYFDRDKRVLFYRFRYREAMEGFERAQNLRVGFELKLIAAKADNGTMDSTPGRRLRLTFINTDPRL